MTNDNAPPAMSETLTGLFNFLDQDPDNIALLSDTAEMALNEGFSDKAKDLLLHSASLTPLAPNDLGTAGLAAMKCRDFEAASSHFLALFEQGERTAPVRFNLAWSLAMIKDFDGALEMLDAATVKDIPQAAMLELQIFHDRGELIKAEAKARTLFNAGVDHEGVNAAISVLAMDVDDIVWAKAAALKGGNHPDALTTLGTLALGEDDPEQALRLFNTAMDINRHGPRTWIGKGLSQLITGEADEALKNIDKGAEMFETHIGSWIAAGWAHFVKKDYPAARLRFDKALAIDDNFAESHGSLAVMDVLEGDLTEARRRTKIALKLDRECFSATLAQVLILSGNGNTEKAQQIFERALNTPIDESGRTISRSMTRLGMSSGLH